MIREMQTQDIERVMDIWITANIKAHSFIEEKYWLKHYPTVKQKYLKIAKTFVYIEDDVVVAFLSVLRDSFIGALFVMPGCQNRKIGTALMNHTKEQYSYLEAHAYVKNEKAVRFYKRTGFQVEDRQENLDSHFLEYVLIWKKADA